MSNVQTARWHRALRSTDNLIERVEHLIAHPNNECGEACACSTSPAERLEFVLQVARFLRGELTDGLEHESTTTQEGR